MEGNSEQESIKNLLRENNRLEEENQRMLKYIYRSTRWGTIFTIFKWIIIVGLAVGLFYYLRPIYDNLNSLYQTVTTHPLPDFSKYFKP